MARTRHSLKRCTPVTPYTTVDCLHHHNQPPPWTTSPPSTTVRNDVGPNNPKFDATAATDPAHPPTYVKHNPLCGDRRHYHGRSSQPQTLSMASSSRIPLQPPSSKSLNTPSHVPFRRNTSQPLDEEGDRWEATAMAEAEVMDGATETTTMDGAIMTMAMDAAMEPVVMEAMTEIAPRRRLHLWK
ncbi:unnamed protein product [Cuscuta europaea]|uniref:Uncharacterized protein n=1 Tax=Cuscuta europaea TaxID=41803 RepID=A0A9P1E3G4_CUSEU|nr:unnamed protein product [Cuscuta europaea]